MSRDFGSDSLRVAIAFAWIAVAFDRLNQYETAVEYYDMAVINFWTAITREKNLNVRATIMQRMIEYEARKTRVCVFLGKKYSKFDKIKRRSV